MAESLFEHAVQFDLSGQIDNAVRAYIKCVWARDLLPEEIRLQALLNRFGIYFKCLDDGFLASVKPRVELEWSPFHRCLEMLAIGRQEFGDKREFALWEEMTLCWVPRQWNLRRLNELDRPDEPHVLLELMWFCATEEMRNRPLLERHLASLPEQRTCLQDAVRIEIECALKLENHLTQKREAEQQNRDEGAAE